MGTDKLLALLITLVLPSCGALLPTEADPLNCVTNPSLCSTRCGEVCNPKTKTCSALDGACASASDCPAHTNAVCAFTVECGRAGPCIPCETDEHCKTWSTTFNQSPRLNLCLPTADGADCVECKTDADCTALPKDSNDHQPDPMRPSCDSLSHQCRG